MGWQTFLYEQIGAEISRVTRYYDRVLQWHPLPWDRGELLDAVDGKHKEALSADDCPDCSGESERRTALLLNANLNYDTDVQALLQGLKGRFSRTTRIVAVLYNPYLRWAYWLADRLGLRRGEPPQTFVTRTVLANLAQLAGFELVRERPVGYLPFRMLGLAIGINRLLSALPLLRHLSVASVVVLRPVLPARERPSLSIVIPARNERGNIEAALDRMPDFGGAELEVLFVEGGSTDGTWEEIQRVAAEKRPGISCRALQQKGTGKVDAVRTGFAEARSELLTILDADLTMPPELLVRYYEAYCQGQGDFINGSRLVYPMEGEAMQFLNQLGNVFFAKTLAAILGAPITDTLCGTKLLTRSDYARMCAWREDFGDFDPFGDYELLFPAALMGLGIADLPVRYRARTYGSTNIHRFRHGAMLLKMTITGFFRIRMVSK